MKEQPPFEDGWLSSMSNLSDIVRNWFILRSQKGLYLTETFSDFYLQGKVLACKSLITLFGPC